MDVFQIRGVTRLEGEVTVAGAKNSSLKLMAASLLAVGKSVIRDVPNILDVTIMAELLRRLGCVVEYDPDAQIISIDVPEQIEHLSLIHI